MNLFPKRKEAQSLCSYMKKMKSAENANSIKKNKFNLVIGLEKKLKEKIYVFLE